MKSLYKNIKGEAVNINLDETETPGEVNPEIKVNDLPIKDEFLTKPKLEKVMNELTLITSEENPNLKIGIDAVMVVVDAFAELKEAYDIAVADDGKVSFGDVLKHPMEIAYQPLKAAFDVWKEKDLILPQIVDVDFAEAEIIIAAVKEKFGIAETEKAKKIIENAFKALYHIKETIEAFK